jgi:hypothetical protein
MLSSVSLSPAINCSPVSTTLPINCLPVSTTPPINFSTDRGLCFLQNYLRLPKSATAADIVIGTAMKRRKGPSHALIRGPWGRQNYCKPKRHYLVLATSGASDQDVWGVYGCNFLWRFQWHYRGPWPTLAAGDIADLSLSTFSYPWQLPISMASVFLTPAINLSPVSLTPVIYLSPVSTTPAITENPWQGLIAGVVDTGDKFFAGVVDTGDKH